MKCASGDLVEVLLRSGLSVLTEDEEGDSVLHLVCRSRNLECVKSVAAAAARQIGAPQRPQGYVHGGGGRVGGGAVPAVVAGRVSRVSGCTPLHHAAQAGDLECVELLLEGKAQLVYDKRQKFLKNPLYSCFT
jgi:ankyrin repeat protein